MDWFAVHLKHADLFGSRSTIYSMYVFNVYCICTCLGDVDPFRTALSQISSFCINWRIIVLRPIFLQNRYPGSPVDNLCTYSLLKACCKCFISSLTSIHFETSRNIHFICTEFFKSTKVSSLITLITRLKIQIAYFLYIRFQSYTKLPYIFSKSISICGSIR